MDTHCVALFDDIYGDYIVVLSSVLYLCNGTYEDPSGNWHELDRAMIGIVLLKRMPNLKVAFSINTLDDNFRADMDKGSSIKDRLHAIEKLHNEGIHTVLFMSPIFPYITEWKDIIDSTKENVCEYWFENLNLRGEYKSSILSYINTHYPDLKEKYEAIYLNKDNTYWNTLADLLNTYCDELGLNYVNYFYHEKLVKEKLNNQ